MVLQSNGKPIIVSHLYPDADSCTSIWLLKRFVYTEAKLKLKFRSIGTRVEEAESRVIYVDHSIGQFDHHNTNSYVCTASIIMEKYGLDSDRAIKRIVDKVLRIDHGLVYASEIDDFHFINVLEGLNWNYPKRPTYVVSLACQFLDGIYSTLKELYQAEDDFEGVITFNTKWGMGAGIESINNKIRYLAHRKGYDVFLYVNPLNGFRGFTSPGHKRVDFTEVYNKLRKIEPWAEWFLHSSKQLLLCGSKKAPMKKLSNMKLRDMINLIIEK